MVKVQLKHTIHRYVYGGKNYYPGDILEVDEKALTLYMTVLPEKVVAPVVLNDGSVIAVPCTETEESVKARTKRIRKAQKAKPDEDAVR